MNNQRTSVKPVSEGLAELLGRMVKDASCKYPGGTDKLELVKGDPDFISELYRHFDARAKKRAQDLSIITRSPFATIKIGMFKNVRAMRRALSDNKCRVSDYASELMDLMILAKEPMTLDLYRASNAELGLTQGGSVAQSFEAITKIGGVKLPAEAGPQYHLQNTNQKLDEWKLMYMDPITDNSGYLSVFSVGHDRGMWLHGDNARPDGFYSAVHVWVFGRK